MKNSRVPAREEGVDATMVFKRLLGSLGVGGPTVDTVLDPGPVRPGGALSGQIHLKGGSADFDVDHLTLELVARVEVEHEEGESDGVVVFDRTVAGGGFRLAEGETRSVPFTLTLPWETPVTELYGQPLGVVLGVRTELAVSGAKDKGDLDQLTVTPLPAQEAVLEAFGQLGFGFRSADLEYGRIGGTGQRLPFYQEIEITPPPQYAGVFEEIEVTFLAGPSGVEVILEADRREGYSAGSSDVLGRHVIGHQDVRDWNAEVEGWVRQLAERRGSYGYGAQGYAGQGGPEGYGSYGDQGSYGSYGDSGKHDAYGHGGAGHEEHRRSGPGVGTAVAAGAAGLAVGVVGGMVAAEVVDEIGDFFEGDDEGED